MVKQLMKTGIWLGLGIGLLLTACTESTELDDTLIENFVDQSLFGVQSEGNIGKFGCYEFVFPVGITFPDESSTEVESYDEMKAAFRTWKEENPDVDGRPTLSFPLDVIDEEGNLITIEERAELRALRRACIRDFFNRHGYKGHGKRGHRCFKLQYPASILFPDGTEQEFDDGISMRLALREWRKENGQTDVKPSLVYPITVILEDETTQELASKEEMIELKMSCRD